MSDAQDLSNTGGTGATNNQNARTSSAQIANSASGNNYDVPEEVLINFPDLVRLIRASESMTDDERTYWFQTLPIMSEEQVNSLRQILTNETTQLKQLDQKYQTEIDQISNEQTQDWQKYQSSQKREDLIQQEKAAEEEESRLEESLLEELDNL